jgi:hypothetical protein
MKKIVIALFAAILCLTALSSAFALVPTYIFRISKSGQNAHYSYVFGMANKYADARCMSDKLRDNLSYIADHAGRFYVFHNDRGDDDSGGSNLLLAKMLLDDKASYNESGSKVGFASLSELTQACVIGAFKTSPIYGFVTERIERLNLTVLYRLYRWCDSSNHSKIAQAIDKGKSTESEEPLLLTMEQWLRQLAESKKKPIDWFGPTIQDDTEFTKGVLSKSSFSPFQPLVVMYREEVTAKTIEQAVEDSFRQFEVLRFKTFGYLDDVSIAKRNFECNYSPKEDLFSAEESGGEPEGERLQMMKMYKAYRVDKLLSPIIKSYSQESALFVVPWRELCGKTGIINSLIREGFNVERLYFYHFSSYTGGEWERCQGSHTEERKAEITEKKTEK